jgi:hypothetical protein
MIELYSMMWVIATFASVIGFLRGWNKEVVVTAGAVLGMFMLFQFDSLLRGVLLNSLARDQVFFIQAGLFMLIVYGAYQTRMAGVGERGRAARGQESGMQSGLLGGIVGFLNGYLIMGTLWYFLDINEYPLAPMILAPGPNSPSAQNVGTIPMVILSGGVTGNGDFLVVIVIVLLLLVIMSL